MARTYDIVCHDCKTYLWIGQGTVGRDARLYDKEKIATFLFGHLNHRLEFGEVQALDLDGYTELEPDEEGEDLSVI